MALGLTAPVIDSGTVLLLIPVIVLPIAAISFARSASAWKSVGRGPFSIEPELPPARITQPLRASSAAQALEVRQMIEARAYRQERRGEPPLDVDLEVERALSDHVGPSPSIDRELRAEIRQLVLTRNERRLRRGLAPLDVEAEVERQIADFS